MFAFSVTHRRPSVRPLASVAAACAIVLASLALGAAAARAQGEPSSAPAPSSRLDARGVAALVQSFYDQMRTIEAHFEQTRFTKLYDRTDRAHGTVVFKKPGRMRWDYDAPNGQIFVSDGQTLRIYQPPEEGEAHGQVIERSVDAAQLPEALSFLTGTGRLARDFEMRLLEPPEGSPADLYVLELRPRTPSPRYDRVLFFVRVVHAGGRAAGVIERVVILDAVGNRNQFDFSKLRFNRAVPDSRFTLKVPKGTRRIRK